MPRTTTTRITPRPQIDSSRSQNVPLPVVASQRDVAGYGNAMFGLARALNGMSSAVGQVGRTNYLAQQKQDNEDAEAGKAAAAQRAVTGEAPDLTVMSDAFAKSYRETDGLRYAGDFENALMPELSRLEPGQDADEFIQGAANKFVDDHGDMPEDAKRVFMLAVAHKQDEWKQGYLKRSIGESMKREEESLGAIAVDQFSKNLLTTPEGLQSFRLLAAHRGLHDDETNALLVSSAAAAMQDGKGNIEAIMATLQSVKLPDGGTLADVPENKEKLELAAQRGQAVQEQAQKDAQRGELAQAYFHLHDKADRGVLADSEIESTRVKYGLTPEWAVQMHDKNREARERFAKENAKADEGREQLSALYSGDPFRIAALGYDKVASAGSKVIAQAYKDGNEPLLMQTVAAASKVNAPMPFLGQLFRQFDPSDIQNAKKQLALRDLLVRQSKEYAESNIPSTTAAMFKRFDIETKVLGLSPEQALQKIAQTSPVLDKGESSAAVSRYLKKHESAIPATFDDRDILGGKLSATPIANRQYVNAQVADIAKELVATGQLEPEAAVEHAIERFRATNVRVGDLYVPVPTGTTQKVGTAMTRLAEDYKSKLIADKVIDDGTTLWFQPAVNDPGKWILMRNDDGVSRAVIEKHRDGSRDFVEKDIHDVMSKYARWETDKKVKEITRAQGLDKLGLGFLKGADEKTLRGRAGQLAHTKDELLGVTGMTFDGKVIASGKTNHKQDSKQLESLIDETKTSSFLDFLHSTH